jgi:molecular chaperone DnaJ
MNIQEAFKTLDLAPGADQTEIKKRYKEYTKKYHPDLNKEPGSEDKFKKINQAYNILSSKEKPSINRSAIDHTINTQIKISFKESVLGCRKEISYNRYAQCTTCSGRGNLPINNGCKKCNGLGQIRQQSNNMIFVQGCPECRGKVNFETCSSCFGEGLSSSDVSMNVSIPPGVSDGNILRLEGAGNFVGNFGPFENYGDVFILINVDKSEDNLRINNSDVISEISISLLDALEGCKRTTPTIDGVKNINIPPGTKNNDTITLNNLGVSRVGNHKVIINVEYPNDINSLVNFLRGS